MALALSDALQRRKTAESRTAPRKFGARSWRLFRHRRTAELFEHVGVPSPTQRALIDHLVDLEWALAKGIAANSFRTWERIEIEKLIRRDLRELGHRPRQAPVPHLAQHVARRRAEAAV